MIYNICYLFLLFLIYSFIGWIIEVINLYLQEHHFINRGFLIGPYCPIYGVGVILMISFLKDYTPEPLVLFILSMVLCMTLEYLTSYLMEKIFHARWWDYSERKYNLNGRVCLETTIPFGLLGLFVMYILNPLVESFLISLSHKLIIILGIIFIILFIIDLIISLIVIIKFRNKTISYKDETELFNKKVLEYLETHTIFIKRLINSFPDIKNKLRK